MNSNLPLSEQFRIVAFEDRMIPEPNSGCWLWMGMLKDTGYGHFCFKQKTVRAHRASWEIYNGAIPDGLHVLHRCDNRSCVNPEHLFLGTHQDNMRDCHEKGRAIGPQGEAAHLAKLTTDDVLAIRAMPYDRRTLSTLSRQYGVSTQTIHKIIKRKTWKHV